MDRATKISTVEELSSKFREIPHFILTGFTGLSVNQATELRRRIRSAGGTYTVIKNRLAKRAAAGTPAEKVAESLAGPRAVAFHETDPVALAKILKDFSAENPQLELVAGLVDAKDVLDASGIKFLAALPSLPELRAQILALVQTPATALVRLLNTPGAQVARVLDARSEGSDSGAGD